MILLVNAWELLAKAKILKVRRGVRAGNDQPLLPVSASVTSTNGT